MNAIVVKTFRDKSTFKRYVIGSIFEGGAERVSELAALGYLKAEVTDIAPSEQVAETPKPRKKKGDA